MNNNDFVFIKMTNEHAAEKEQPTKRKHKRKIHRIHIKPFWKMTKREVAEGLIGCLGSTVIMAGVFFIALVF